MATKKYYENFKFTNENYLITHTRTTHKKTDSGKSWRSKPDSTEKKLITAAHYTNFVNSIPFFNGFCGGTCRAKQHYTVAGYFVTTITSISPDGQTKHIDTFDFHSFPYTQAYREGGYREKDVLKNMCCYKYENHGGRRVYTFYHCNGSQSAAYDISTHTWVN